MEIILWFALYSLIGVASGLFMTRLEYANSIRNNEDALPASDSLLGKEMDEAKRNKLEIERRKRLALKAKRSGFICAILWPLCFAIMLISGTFKLFDMVTDKFAIEPSDEPFELEQKAKEAQKILDEYNRKQIEDFNKQLEGN